MKIQWRRWFRKLRAILYSGAAVSIALFTITASSGHAWDKNHFIFLGLMFFLGGFYAVSAISFFRERDPKPSVPRMAPAAAANPGRPLTLIEKRIAEEKKRADPLKKIEELSAIVEQSTDVLRDVKMGIYRALIDLGAVAFCFGFLLAGLFGLLRFFIPSAP